MPGRAEGGLEVPAIAGMDPLTHAQGLLDTLCLIEGAELGGIGAEVVDTLKYALLPLPSGGGVANVAGLAVMGEGVAAEDMVLDFPEAASHLQCQLAGRCVADSLHGPLELGRKRSEEHTSELQSRPHL